MSESENCRLCGRELTGVMDIKVMGAGTRTIVVIKATDDCNWRRCQVCKRPACTKCFFMGNWFCSVGCFRRAFHRALMRIDPMRAHVVLDFTEHEISLNGNGDSVADQMNGSETDREKQKEDSAND